jgi:RNA polymerase sigma-70 factor (ECF subfamily)
MVFRPGASMSDEKQLVRRIQQGERRAFEEFVDSYGARVHRLVRRYVQNPTDAEDVTQEVFCDLYRSIGKFRGESALSTWVYRVTVNHCLKHCQRAKPAGLPYEEEAVAVVADDWRSDPAQSAVKQELSEQVQGALHRLSPLHYDVVVLCEMHGLTYQECAQVLEVPVGTVKSRLFHAIRRLREILGGYVLGEGGGLCADTVGERGR